MRTTAGPQRQRLIDHNDVDGWIDAARHREPPVKRDVQTLRNYLEARNRFKWKMLQRYLRWAEKELAALGMMPEDTRWII